MVQVHSLKDLSNGEDGANTNDEAMMGAAAKGGTDADVLAASMPVDGETAPTLFHGLYHEKQIGALCAVHALNNLLQRRAFDEVELATIARELDAAEAAALGGARLEGERESGNVRADGFFSVQVVVAALQRLGLQCAPAAERASRVSDPTRERGFILNRREHWFALRKIGDAWFDLNSMFAAPKHMSETHLDLFFREHMHQGYSVFVVRGDLGRTPLDADAAKLRAAIAECEYQAGAGSANNNDNNKPRSQSGGNASGFTAFSGAGSRLEEDDGPAVDPSLAAAAADDPELAAAIAASLSDQAAAKRTLGRDAKQDADEIRRKRLARFG